MKFIKITFLFAICSLTIFLPNLSSAESPIIQRLEDIQETLDYEVVPYLNGMGVPRTGQTYCWDTAGNPMNCSGTGQDGEYQIGVRWRNPRFYDNLDGTVTDYLTGLIWLKNANCDGKKPWADALTFCNNLASGSCGLSDGSAPSDWRLPNINEMISLVHWGVYAPALPDTDGSGRWSEGDPFTNVRFTGGDPFYWSSTTFEYWHNHAWTVPMSSGGQDVAPKTTSYYVWPVRNRR